jgi:hypothetical protein
MSEPAGPLVVTVGQGLVRPTGSVSDLVIVATERNKIVDAGWSAVGRLNSVVEVTVDGRHSTTRKNAGGVAAFDVPALSGGGSPAGDAVVDGLAALRMSDGPSPLGVLLLLNNLAGDVGDDRSVSGQLARVVSEPGQGFQVDLDVDHTFASVALMGVTLEQVQEDVGSELVEGARLAGSPEALS